ncbi:hypothetical protein [Saliniramus fredricksonii]|uniref:hypothetical protein n=1 Tax=Saliniramus fredricksonii TaxID=1653334 RepID=UPI0013F4F41B|nr:hypothetical protein [Saliniramus fredricksonii]
MNTGLKIVVAGSCLPETKTTNYAIAAQLNPAVRPEWAHDKSGSASSTIVLSHAHRMPALGG